MLVHRSRTANRMLPARAQVSPSTSARWTAAARRCVAGRASTWEGSWTRPLTPAWTSTSYACPSRWFHQDTLAAMPYRVYAAGQLMYRLENMFHEIHQAEASTDVSGHNASFMSRAADFFLRCVSKKKIRGQGPELEELFLHYGLEVRSW
ncbi:hypothetical protein MRX96_035064 [Rhipicephalus microplus]